LTERGGSKALSWEIGNDESEDDNDSIHKGALPEPSGSRRRTVDGIVESKGLIFTHEDGEDNEFGEFAKAEQPH
jgi:hypothetical protein